MTTVEASRFQEEIVARGLKALLDAHYPDAYPQHEDDLEALEDLLHYLQATSEYDHADDIRRYAADGDWASIHSAAGRWVQRFWPDFEDLAAEEFSDDLDES